MRPCRSLQRVGASRQVSRLAVWIPRAVTPATVAVLKRIWRRERARGMVPSQSPGVDRQGASVGVREWRHTGSRHRNGKRHQAVRTSAAAQLNGNVEAESENLGVCSGGGTWEKRAWRRRDILSLGVHGAANLDWMQGADDGSKGRASRDCVLKGSAISLGRTSIDKTLEKCLAGQSWSMYNRAWASPWPLLTLWVEVLWQAVCIPCWTWVVCVRFDNAEVHSTTQAEPGQRTVSQEHMSEPAHQAQQLASPCVLPQDRRGAGCWRQSSSCCRRVD